MSFYDIVKFDDDYDDKYDNDDEVWYIHHLFCYHYDLPTKYGVEERIE